jgi:hypothetical protein
MIDHDQAEPKGKRTIRQTVRGSWIGYVGGRLWRDFGDQPWSEECAEHWEAGGSGKYADLPRHQQ